MSKVLDEFRVAERTNSAGVGNSGDVFAARDAEATALACAGADEQHRREADSRRLADTELLAALRRQQAAEDLAISHAQNRSRAESAAEAVASERAHAERQLENAIRIRKEVEERALADAKRHELAATELARAAQTRLAREREAEAISRQRAESERAAADQATEKLRAERALEALTIARTTAERDAALQAERRKTQEDEAAEAVRMRVRAQHDERQSLADHESAKASAEIAHHQRVIEEARLVKPVRTSSALNNAPDKRPANRPSELLRLGLMLCIGGTLGFAAGYLGKVGREASFRSTVPELWKLRLDDNLPRQPASARPAAPVPK